MNKDERKALAEQLNANPLFHALLDDMEKAAVEALVRADTEQKRVEGQWRVLSVRSFREDCGEYLRSTPERKGAIA